MRQIIQRYNIQLSWFSAVALGCALLFLLTGTSYALPATATWTKDGSIKYNGKTYSQVVVEPTGKQTRYYVSGDDYNCPKSGDIFFNGTNPNKAKKATYEGYDRSAGTTGCVLVGATVSKTVTFTNKSTAGDVTPTPLPGAGGSQGSDGSQHALSDENYCKSQDGRESDPALCGTPCKDADNCSLTAKYINPIINKFLVPLAVIAVIIGIIWGAITYITSGGDPQRVALGKSRITKALLALLLFIFLYALLNWLIPGGLTSSPPPPTTPTDPGALM